MNYPSEVSVEFDWTLEASEEGESDIELTINATGEVNGPDHSVGYFNAHVAYTDWTATDENGKVFDLKGHNYETIDRLVTDKLNEELANGGF